MKRIHYLSGLVLALFIALHLFNHLASVYGAETHIALMDQLRRAYRNPFVETALLAAVAVQIISGISLVRCRKGALQGFYDRLQVRTGLYLAFFLLIHVAAVLIGRYVMELDTNFYFGVAGLNTFPINLFFIPYYALAILSFFGHMAAIHFQKMKGKILGLTVEQQSRSILIVGIIVTLVIFYGLTDRFSGVELPKAYFILIGR
ncbi:hypothetical protein [Pseudozobellia thermophila]|uniref:Uncharacterized protein n=1 Tax=Pseudozobellia thermophila TaxID=192903 RepID=A0A1M6JML4_9FLAO|nr:hypothetical protein [Pseudozobellia thermophila]SHJ47912.1 hypothetical protein SAMN04488513_10581 [Pseudozobellia thermophila]